MTKTIYPSADNPKTVVRYFYTLKSEKRQKCQAKLKNTSSLPIALGSTIFNDNRISLFAGQFGRCAITGEYLARGDVVCRRKVPRRNGGTNEYSNLILVTQAVDDMLNEKDAELAWELSRRLKLDDNKRKKANRLRVAAGLSPMIQGEKRNNLTNVGALRD